MSMQNDTKLTEFYDKLERFEFLAKNWTDPSMKSKKIGKTHARLSVTNTNQKTKIKEGDTKKETTIAEGDTHTLISLS